MKDSMRGCVEILAGLAAALFVITAVLTLFITNLTQVITDRAAVAEILEPETLVGEIAPLALTEAAWEHARAQGTPLADPNPAALQAAIRELLPPGWVETQGSMAIDAMLNYLKTGDPAAAKLQVDASLVLSRLRGEPGRRAVLAVLQLLPPCTKPQPAPGPAPDPYAINYCLPSDVPIAEVTDYTHAGLVEMINRTPQLQPQAGIIRVSLLDEGAMPALRQRSQQVHQFFVLAQRWTWMLWWVPIGCLLVLLLNVHSLSDLGYWWGWTLLVTAVIALFLAFVLPPFLTATVVESFAATTDLPRMFLGRLAQHLLDGLTEVWIRRVYIEAGLMLAGGLLLLIIRYVSALRRSQL